MSLYLIRGLVEHYKNKTELKILLPSNDDGIFLVIFELNPQYKMAIEWGSFRIPLVNIHKNKVLTGNKKIPLEEISESTDLELILKYGREIDDEHTIGSFIHFTKNFSLGVKIDMTNIQDWI